MVLSVQLNIKKKTINDKMPKLKSNLRLRLQRKGSVRFRREDFDKENEATVLQKHTVMSGVCCLCTLPYQS